MLTKRFVSKKLLVLWRFISKLHKFTKQSSNNMHIKQHQYGYRSNKHCKLSINGENMGHSSPTHQQCLQHRSQQQHQQSQPQTQQHGYHVLINSNELNVNVNCRAGNEYCVNNPNRSNTPFNYFIEYNAYCNHHFGIVNHVNNSHNNINNNNINVPYVYPNNPNNSNCNVHPNVIVSNEFVNCTSGNNCSFDQFARTNCTNAYTDYVYYNQIIEYFK